MTKKISISLPEHVYSLAKKKSRLTHGDNFSGYIRDLICKQFSDKELGEELIEVSKPLWTGKQMVAGFGTICEYCKEPIIKDVTTIYQTNLGFEDDWKNWVHKDCCRKE